MEVIQNESAKKPDFHKANAIFKSVFDMATFIGKGKQEAINSANAATLKETGVDFLDLMNEGEVIVTKKFHLPREIAKQMNMGSRDFNKMLQEYGYQTRRDNSWYATSKGRPFSQVIHTYFKDKKGNYAQKLSWSSDLIDALNHHKVS